MIGWNFMPRRSRKQRKSFEILKAGLLGRLFLLFEEHRNSIGILQEFEALSNSFAYGSDYYQFPWGTLDYTFHDANSRTRDLLIIGHGVTGNKDRPFVVSLAEAVEEEGLSVLRFSFAGNGGSVEIFVNVPYPRK